VCLSRLQLTLQTQLQYRSLKVASNHQGKSQAEIGSAYIRTLAWEEWLYVGQAGRVAWCARLITTLNQLPRIISRVVPPLTLHAFIACTFLHGHDTVYASWCEQERRSVVWYQYLHV
jgi:hypothetical protein